MSDSVRCRSCRIEVERMVGLSPGGSAGFKNEPRAVAVNHAGRYYVLAGQRPETYTANGKPEGELGGPTGPLARVEAMMFLAIDPTDSIRAFDGAAAQYLTLSPTGEVIRSAPVSPPLHLNLGVPRGDGSLVMYGGTTGGLREAPLHLVSAAGRVTKDFGLETVGATSSELTAGGARAWQRSIAVATSTSGTSSIWAAHTQRYVVDQYDVDGKLVASVVRTAAWFPSWSAEWQPTVDRAPPRMLRRVLVDDAGLLWTFILVPRENWRDAVHASPVAGRPPRFVPQQAFETIIEVIDPNRGQLLASRKVPWYVSQVVSNDRVGSYSLRADETGSVDIWRIRLRR